MTWPGSALTAPERSGVLRRLTILERLAFIADHGEVILNHHVQELRPHVHVTARVAAEVADLQEQIARMTAAQRPLARPIMRGQQVLNGVPAIRAPQAGGADLEQALEFLFIR